MGTGLPERARWGGKRSHTALGRPFRQGKGRCKGPEGSGGGGQVGAWVAQRWTSGAEPHIPRMHLASCTSVQQTSVGATHLLGTDKSRAQCVRS